MDIVDAFGLLVIQTN